MRKDSVPVYSRNAVSASEKPLYYTSEVEARRLIEEKKAVVVSRRAAPLKIQMLALQRKEHQSAATISFYEMRINAGEGSRKQVEAIREKVACFQIPSWTDRVVHA